MGAPPTCTPRQSLSFLHDPADFTAGEGLALGDFYRVRIPGQRLWVVTDPDLVERILVRDADHFVKGRIYWSELRRTIGDSIGSMDGDRWGYLHSVERDYFTPKAVAAYAPSIQRRVEEYVDEVSRRTSADPPDSVLDGLVRLNASVVLATLFGREREPELEEITRRIADGHEIIAWRSKYPWRRVTGWLNGINRRAEDHRRYFDGYVERLGARDGDAADLQDALRRVRDAPDAPAYTDSLLRNEIVFHLGASTETQAAAEGWTLYLLWKHPEILERMRREIDAVVGDAEVTPQHVPLLGLTRRALQEALRLYPPVYGIVRDCRTPVDLGAHRARPGEAFLVSVYGLHRSPRIWEAPSEFRPERFGPEAAQIGRYAYIPFGAGKHVCIGQHLATAAMMLTTAQIAQRFDWTFSDDEVRPVARPSLKPSGAFRARFTLRRRAVP